MIWQWYLPYITLIYLEMIWHKISFYTLIWCFTGLTPLAHAVKSKEMEAVKQIIKMGGNINTQDCHGRTPLALATYQVSVHSNKTPITCIYYIYIYILVKVHPNDSYRAWFWNHSDSASLVVIATRQRCGDFSFYNRSVIHQHVLGLVGLVTG